MKKRYNLALLPISKSNELIDLSHTFSSISAGYQLGVNSLPHVTLHHFEAEQNQINSIWNSSSKVLETGIEIRFSQLDYGVYKDMHWISLLPENTNILHKLHALTAQIIQSPINPNYQPHLTLINTKVNNYQTEINRISQSFQSISDKFLLTLGESDKIGQFTKILHQIKLKHL
jgi:2'-5' RNA ligase